MHRAVHCFNATELGCRKVITRVILERLIVARPQPNGLLMCASDLFKSSNLQEEPFVQKVRRAITARRC